jgi:hypothetical protein
MDMNLLKNEAKRMRVILMSDIHYCKEWYGIAPEMKREMLCADLEREYAKDPYGALLLLGDYSLDHWAWNTKGTYLTQGVSDTKRFVEHCLPRMAPSGVEVRMIAGNHEQYGEALWQKLTGFNRRDHMVCGPVLFILLDTFGGDLDPTEHSDGTYIGANMADLRVLMARYPDKKVVLCAHWFDFEKESEEFRSFIAQETRILCLFCGHNHISKVVSTGEEYGNKPIIYTGHYSYSGDMNPVHCLNGYREVLIMEDRITSKYIVPSHTYTMEAVKFTTEYAEQDDVEIKF